VEGEGGGEAHGAGRGERDAVEEAGGGLMEGGPEEKGEESGGHALGCHVEYCG
jgi:hypothetical protein